MPVQAVELRMLPRLSFGGGHGLRPAKNCSDLL
jgi:hypothetical protein